MKKLSVFALITALALASLAGCGKEETSTPTQSETSAVSVEEDEVEIVEVETNSHKGQVQSDLTGEWISKKLALQRPVAVMMSNDPSAQPQYGISQADIVYEAPTEADINRFMLLIQDYKDADTIMPIRSCRPYYLYWALGFDAIYVHYGQSWLAKEDLAKDSTNNLNGMDGSLANVTFFRDSSRKAPQNAYTKGSAITAGIEKKGYSTQHSQNYSSPLIFNDSEEKEIYLGNKEGSFNARVVVPGYTLNKPWFVYSNKDHEYKRYQYGSAHKDAATGKQLSYKNIIIQISDWSVADNKHGYIDLEAVGSGSGYYITNGKAVPITWSKADKSSATIYSYENGRQIRLNRGKTWICVVKESKADGITFYETYREFKEKDTQTDFQ